MNHNRNKHTLIFFLILISFMFIKCKPSMDQNQEKQNLLETDKEFSQMSVDKGIAAAFDFYADAQAVIYRDKAHPVKGRENIRKLYEGASGGTLRWKPTFADVAQSGDLGYTLGSWEYLAPDSSINRGYYVSIWKKQENEKWKYVFDSGIDGPDE